MSNRFFFYKPGLITIKNVQKNVHNWSLQSCSLVPCQSFLPSLLSDAFNSSLSYRRSIHKYLLCQPHLQTLSAVAALNYSHSLNKLAKLRIICLFLQKKNAVILWNFYTNKPKCLMIENGWTFCRHENIYWYKKPKSTKWKICLDFA